MSRAEALSIRRSLGVIASLLAVGLGIGCAGWALSNIAAEATSSYEPYRPVLSSVATPTAERGATTVSVVVPAVVVPRPKEGARFGSLTVPAMKLRLPIIEGTDDADLTRGVGHFTGSVMPGRPDNCVLAGHRDTVLAGVGVLKKGDRLVVQTDAGTFTYAITRTRIVHKDDRTIIVPTDHAVLTVSTCYPFHFIGNAPDRYIISADLVTADAAPLTPAR